MNSSLFGSDMLTILFWQATFEKHPTKQLLQTLYYNIQTQDIAEIVLYIIIVTQSLDLG